MEIIFYLFIAFNLVTSSFPPLKSSDVVPCIFLLEYYIEQENFSSGASFFPLLVSGDTSLWPVGSKMS